MRRYLDWIQDYAVINLLPSILIESDHTYGHKSKLLNATRNDLGPANINLKTAKDIYTQFSSSFPKKMGWAELVDYLLTDEGTVLVAALVIKKGMRDMAAYLVGRSTELRDALLVTYFKQGPSYLSRYKRRLTQDSAAELVPGEGCRSYHMRMDLAKALGTP